MHNHVIEVRSVMEAMLDLLNSLVENKMFPNDQSVFAQVSDLEQARSNLNDGLEELREIESYFGEEPDSEEVKDEEE